MMKRALVVAMMAASLVLAMIASVSAAVGGSQIQSPSAGEMVYGDQLGLSASYDGDAGYSYTGFGVKTSCDVGAGVMVNGIAYDDGSANLVTNPSDVVSVSFNEEGVFSAVIDISEWATGFYCFAFNPGTALVDRVVQPFYIVNGTVVVDASIDEALDTYAPNTGKPDYSVSGTIGLLDAGDLMGMLELRYHNPKITCWADLATGWYETRDYNSTGGPHEILWMYDLDYTCDNDDSGMFEEILLLKPGYQGPNGAIFVTTDGDRTPSSPYDLIGTFENSRNWVPLDRGSAVFNVDW